MGNILEVDSVSDFSAYHGLTARHRLVSVIDYVDLTYGCGKYDYTNDVQNMKASPLLNISLLSRLSRRCSNR